MQEETVLHFELRGSAGLTTANLQTQIQHNQFNAKSHVVCHNMQ